MNERSDVTKDGNGSAHQRVRFEFTHPTAKTVSVAGTFNGWRPGATEMIPLGDGRWLKELVFAPGVYEYRLVVDNEWMPDPLAAETTPNPFGGVNSMLKVSPSSEVSHAKSSAKARNHGRKARVCVSLSRKATPGLSWGAC
jgi:1,4-alpha-glucan branching enzyme